jgi:protein TonB
MLDRLLESKAKRERSAGGGIASVAAHTVPIGLAVYATAQARIGAPPSAQVVRPVYFPSRRPHAPSAPTTGSVPRIGERRLVFVDPAVNISLPSIDVPLPGLGLGDFHRDLAGGPESSGGGQVDGEGSGATFRAEQVEKQVSVINGSAPPRYPELLRAAGIEGRVVARFVVNEGDSVEEGSVKFIQSDNHLFDEAVRAALLRMRFSPAEIGGRKVRQLVEMPFVFALSR